MIHPNICSTSANMKIPDISGGEAFDRDVMSHTSIAYPQPLSSSLHEALHKINLVASDLFRSDEAETRIETEAGYCCCPKRHVSAIG